MTTAKTPDPDYVYVGFVRSLFNAPTILIIGGVIHALITLTIYHASGDPVYIVLAVALLLAGVYRFYGIRLGQLANNIHDMDTARDWENHYLLGGTLQAFLLGLLCFATLYIAPVPFGETGVGCRRHGVDRGDRRPQLRLAPHGHHPGHRRGRSDRRRPHAAERRPLFSCSVSASFLISTCSSAWPSMCAPCCSAPWSRSARRGSWHSVSTVP